jgi:hypothetical protein
MNQFKKNWEIQYNWQLLFPFLGLIILFYSSYKLANVFISTYHFGIKLLLTVAISFLLLKFTLFIFKKLEKKWQLDFRWEMIRVFIVFAITGSTSVFIGKPIIKAIGITKENLNIGLYWFLYITIAFIFYHIFLVIYGWLLGQHKFFWAFEKKMLKRFGLGRFLK